MRPCVCDNVRPGRPFDRARDCPQCWMWRHVSRFNRAYGGDGAVTPVRRAGGLAACASLGERLPGQPCGSLARRCNYHGDATVAHGLTCPAAQRECGKCHDFIPADRPELPPIRRRHLVYHLLPVLGRWKRHVDELRRRWDLFDGTKTVAVLEQPGRATRTHGGEDNKTFDLDPPDRVAAYLPGDAAIIRVENDPARREVATWVPLWERVLDHAGPDDAVWYGHAKGVTRGHPPGSPVELWADLLYRLHLDHWPRVERSLAYHPITGVFLKAGVGFPDSRESTWHYSGSPFWVRAGEMRGRAWRLIPQAWYGTEAWPGLAFRDDEAGCFFHRGTVGDTNLYDRKAWDKILPEYERWASG